MILCIGTTPAAQRVMLFPKLAIDEVNRAVISLDGAAGKSVNVAKVLRALGERPLATGFLGSGRGKEIRAALESRGIELDFIEVPASARLCITVIDQSTGSVTELVEESKPVAAEDYEILRSKISRQVPACRAVIMSGSLTPGAPLDFYRRCTELAAAAGAMPVIDAQGLPLAEGLKARPALVKPNRVELGATVGRELADLADTCSAMRELHERGAQRVVVTAGKDPVLAFDGTATWRIVAPRIAALNPIGSGDAFTAALVWRLLRGDDLGEACRWGAAAGAANALTPMPGELDPGEVERLVLQTTLVEV